MGVTYGTPVIAVGSPSYFGFVDLKVSGQDPVHLVGAHLLGLPSGLRVIGTYAVAIHETVKPGGRLHYIADLGPDDLRKSYPGLRLHPITDAVIQPGKPLDWYVVFEVAPTRYGDFKTSGVEIDYRAGDSQGAQTFDGFHIEVRCGPAATPSPTQPSPSP